jgi:hypothetical protein
VIAGHSLHRKEEEKPTYIPTTASQPLLFLFCFVLFGGTGI